MEIFIATENIKRFKALILIEKDETQKKVLLDLLRREEQKLLAASNCKRR